MKERLAKGKRSRHEDEYPYTAGEGSENKKKSTYCASEDVLLYEILPWVPLKTLFKFKSVSKRWHEVISVDPVFKSSQIHRSLTSASRPPGGILYYGNQELPLEFWGGRYRFLPTTIGGRQFVSMPDEKLKYLNLTDGHLRASSNGLLCSYPTGSTPPTFFYVTNPITKECISIPNPRGLQDIALAFEPLACNPFFLLVSRDVFINLDYTGNFKHTIDCGFAVYSSKTGLWTTSSAKVCFQRLIWGFFQRQCPVYSGGKLFWKQEGGLLWFDIKKDVAGALDLPLSDLERKEGVYAQGEIGDCDGKLTCTKLTADYIEIWFLGSNENTDDYTWMKKCHLSIREMLLHDMKEVSFFYNTMVSHKKRPLPYDGGDLVQFWVREIMGVGKRIILSYNLKTGLLQLIHHSGIYELTVLYPYTSSFASVPRPSMDG